MSITGVRSSTEDAYATEHVDCVLGGKHPCSLSMLHGPFSKENISTIKIAFLFCQDTKSN